jgi:hypothetical protein
MRVNNEKKQLETQKQQQEPQYSQYHSEISTMQGILHQQGDRMRKANRIGYAQETSTQNTIGGSNNPEQYNNTKRQRVEEDLRVGLAKQASPDT